MVAASPPDKGCVSRTSPNKKYLEVPVRSFLAVVTLSVVAFSVSACGDAGDPVILGADKNTEARNKLGIVPSEISLTEGETLSLKASLTGPSSATFDPSQVVWSVDDNSVASVSAAGVLTALRHGEIEVRASYGSLLAIAPTSIQGIPRAMEAAAALELTGAVGRQLPDSIRVKVLDKDGLPVPNVEVRFEVLTGEGEVGDESGISDGDGYAKTAWTLGPDLGPQQLRASLGDLPEIVFSAEAVPDYLSPRVLMVRGDEQEGEVATVLPEPLQVQVVDTFGHVLAGIPIEWTFNDGGGSSSAPSANLSSVPDLTSTTDGEGFTQTYWQLGTRAGLQEAIATVDMGSSVASGVSSPLGVPKGDTPAAQKFKATGKPGKPDTVSVDPSSTSIPPGVQMTLIADVTDRFGNEIAETDLRWNADNTTVVTVDQAGTIQALRPGTAEVTASSGNISGTAFVEVTYATSPSVASVEVVPSTATISAGQTHQFTAVARDESGNPMTGLSFAWHSFNPSVAVVEGTGLAAGVSGGSAIISATVEGVSGMATLTVEAQLTNGVQKISGDGQNGTVGSVLSEPLRVRVFTDLGAPIVGRALTWAVTGGGGSVSPSSGATDADGYAEAFWTLGTKPGGNAAKATVEGMGEVVFGANALVGPATTVTVMPVTATVGTGSARQFQAEARDRYGNPLSGVTFIWSSSNTNVATASSDGIVTGVAAGSATIQAATETISGTSTLTVTANPVVENPGSVTDLGVSSITDTSVTLTWTEVDDGTGAPARYAVRMGSPSISWGDAYSTEISVPGTAIGSVVTHTWSGLAPGTPYQFQLVSYRGTLNRDAVFGALSNVATGATTGTRTGPIVASVTVSPGSATLETGQTEQLTATARDGSGNVVTGISFTWSSSSPGVATVDASGLVTAATPGYTTITATTSGFSGSSFLAVTSPGTLPPGSWDHEPYGYTLFTDRPVSAISEADWSGQGSGLSVTSEGSEPHSPSRSLQFHYPKGAGGAGKTVYVGNTWFTLPDGTQEVYVGMYLKLSSPWDEHATHNDSPKLVFLNDLGTGGGGDPFYIRRGDDGRIDGKIQNSDAPPERLLGQNVGDVRTSPGQWAKVEFVVKMNSPGKSYDGEFHLWVNDVKVAQYTDLWLSDAAAPQWNALNINPLWGGLDDTLTVDQFLWVDHVRVSGR